MLPLDRSVNCTAKGAWPEVVFAVKSAVGAGGGGAVTWIARVLLSEPPLPFTVSVTVYPPALLYVCDGLCVELCDEPSPKSQSRLVMLPLDRSVNCTAKGAWPEVVLAVKSAVGAGGGGAVAWIARLLLLEPPLPVTVSVAV